MQQCVSGSYHEGDDAPLSRLPLEAAVDVRPVADQDHDAPLHTVKVLLQQLDDTKYTLKYSQQTIQIYNITAGTYNPAMEGIKVFDVFIFIIYQ